MKRTLALFFALVLLITMFPASVLAADAAVISFTTDASDKLEIGDAFKVTATLSDNVGFASSALTLKWNSEVVRFAGFEGVVEDEEFYLEPSIFNDMRNTTVVVNNELGFITSSRASNSNLKGVLFVANFEVVGYGDCDISMDQSTDDSFFLADQGGSNLEVNVIESDVADLVVVNSSEDSYTATLTGQNVIVHVEDTFEIYLGADKDFAATEIELTYDTTLVEFVEDKNATYSIKEIEVGKLKLADYGADKTAGEQIYALTFNAIAEGDAVFAVTKAGFGTGTSAEDKNLYEAALPEKLIVPITVETHTVTLDKVDGKDIFDQTGEKIVESGESFTFKPETSTGAYYNYDEITIKMGESIVKATLQEDGTYVMTGDTDDLVVSYVDGQWTIVEVTGDVTITGKRTAKSYRVKVEYNKYTPSGIGEEVSLPQDAPTYGEDYIFYIPEDRAETTYEEGYKYTATVTVNGVSVDCDVDVLEYTISGMDITGDVVITVTRDTIPASGANMVSVEISGADLEFEGISGTYTSVNLGEEVTLVLTEQTGYIYTIKANGTDITTRFEDGKYTFNVNEDTAVEVIRDVDVTYAKAEQYVTMKDEKSMWIVMISPEETGAQIEGKTYTFGGKQMLWSSKYNAYCILVIAETAPEMTGFEIISVEKIPEIAYNYDVNGSENATVDANDAQLVYNMYNATYEDFTSAVTMEKFFKADIIPGATEGTSTYLGVTDAAAIIAAILDGTVN